MHINQSTRITTDDLTLVPYCVHHVKKYHEWMRDETLRELTASEPLSLDQEFEMQRKWATDDDKCTFIILSNNVRSHKAAGTVTENDINSTVFEHIPMSEGSCKQGEEIERMIGDVNLFLTDLGDRSRAELEVMIAESTARGNGYGKQAVVLIMIYGISQLNIELFEVKIGRRNDKSIRLFEKLGFTTVSVSDVFDEITMNCDVSDRSVVDKLKSLAPSLVTGTYSRLPE